MFDEPTSARRMAEDLGKLGVTPGDVLIVHTSMRSLGYVIGGSQAVLDALHAAVGTEGTLVMPTQSWQSCDPAFLAEPGVPEEWWPAIRDGLPAYDPARSPSQSMGVVAELLRTEPGARRSGHPHRSITASGSNASVITARHDLDCPSGERSPLAVLYELRAMILLLGVKADRATAQHLAEHRAEFARKHLVPNGAPILHEGRREWRSWRELAVDDGDFLQVADAYANSGLERRVGLVGAATAQLIPMRRLVDFAVDWFTAHR